eukprot:398642-Lingulodinium_polyedra.AAC.1
MLQKGTGPTHNSRLAETLRTHALQDTSRARRGRSEGPTYDLPGRGRGCYPDVMDALAGSSN